jgi:hypothetical protein
MRIYLLCFMIAATIGVSVHVILVALLAQQAPRPLTVVLLAYNWAWTITRNEIWRNIWRK